MPRVIANADNLNELNANFAQKALQRPVFLNSVPKSGTHLLRNIVRMFVPVEQQYHDTFIQHPVLRQNLRAFSANGPKLSWGHLLFSDDASIVLKKVHHLLLVRDPYDWVLARARFFLSDNFEAELDHLKNGNAPIDAILNMMIFGIHQKVPALWDIYTHNCVSWLGTSAQIIKYEELTGHCRNLATPEAETYFRDLFAKCGMDHLPEDWRERVEIGSDRKKSGTARENLKSDGGAANIPDELPDIQKRLVDYAAPGLRTLLGYA